MFPAIRHRLNSFSSSVTWSHTEQEAMGRLARSYSKLHFVDGQVDTKTDEGHDRCSPFLETLECAAATLQVETVPRHYREKFSVNYRALFPDERRNYRVDVLEASNDQQPVIYVNGDKYEFSADAISKAALLQIALYELLDLVSMWKSGSSMPERAKVCKLFEALDEAWANFEERYITELMKIEDRSRQVVVDAIEAERVLQRLEKTCGKTEFLTRLPAYREALRNMATQISRLNAVANVKRKGRDDLGADILFDALDRLHEYKEARQNTEDSDRFVAARVLTAEVLETFKSMRSYFRHVSHCIESVDPHLCNNAGLVARLADWEESWEIGARYVQNAGLLDGMCDVVAQIRSAQQIVPALTSMCQDCDVELFFVLPRLIWLRFLDVPEVHVDLLRSLLPHRFTSSKLGSATVGLWDAELSAFIAKYQKVKGLLMDVASLSEIAAWGVLVKRVVLGSGAAEQDNIYRGIAPAARSAMEPHFEDLMRDLESRSIELQRHNAEDWNQCIAILVLCLSGEGRKSKDVHFDI